MQMDEYGGTKMKIGSIGGLFRTVAVIAIATATYLAQNVTEITLPGTRVFPESITSTADGTLIVGSLGHGNVLRIAPGKTGAEWIKPGTGGLNNILGVYADEKGSCCGSVPTISRTKLKPLPSKLSI
jgi:hypothetical protein